MCMYVCICMHMCACLCVYVRVYAHVCAHMCTCMYIHMHVCSHVYMCICMHVCICVWMCVHVCKYMYICMHVYTCVCVCMYMSMYVCMYVYECVCVCLCVVCMYVYIGTCLYICVYVCMHMHVCMCGCVCMCICVHAYACVFVCVYMCMRVCVCICMHAFVCVCACLCAYVCVFVYVCMHMCMHVCAYVCVYTYVCVYLCVFVCVHMYACVCVCVYAYVCVCVCMHMCVYMCMCVYVCVCGRSRFWRAGHWDTLLWVAEDRKARVLLGGWCCLGPTPGSWSPTCAVWTRGAQRGRGREAGVIADSECGVEEPRAKAEAWWEEAQVEFTSAALVSWDTPGPDAHSPHWSKGQCPLWSAAVRVTDPLGTLPGPRQGAVTGWLRAGALELHVLVWDPSAATTSGATSLPRVCICRLESPHAPIVMEQRLQRALPCAKGQVSTGKMLVLVRKGQWFVLFSYFQRCFWPFSGLKEFLVSKRF